MWKLRIRRVNVGGLGNTSGIVRRLFWRAFAWFTQETCGLGRSDGLAAWPGRQFQAGNVAMKYDIALWKL
jgi:hypothetical protein